MAGSRVDLIEHIDDISSVCIYVRQDTGTVDDARIYYYARRVFYFALEIQLVGELVVYLTRHGFISQGETDIRAISEYTHATRYLRFNQFPSADST